MKRFVIVLTICTLAACSNSKVEVPTSSTVSYYNLHNTHVDYNTPFVLDINKDGINDFHFIATFAEGSGNGRLEFSAVSEGESLIFAENRTPKAFNKFENININNAGLYTWTKLNPVLLTSIYTDDPSNNNWEGAWNNKVDKYLGVKVKGNGNFYTGWIRISYSAITSRITINDCAISKNSGFGIQAGAAS